MDQLRIPPSIIDALTKARHVVGFTGAGVSQESGILTFRDALTACGRTVISRNWRHPPRLLNSATWFGAGTHIVVAWSCSANRILHTGLLPTLAASSLDSR